MEVKLYWPFGINTGKGKSIVLLVANIHKNFGNPG